MQRRSVLAAGAVMLALPPATLAQSGKVWRFGVLLHNFRFERLRLRALLTEIGLEEGRNLLFEVRSTQGLVDRLDSLAAELVAAKVDLILALNNPEIQAAMRATQAIPILMLFGAAPVETGLIASLSRPGGNVTGTSTNAPELTGKMVELMHELLPRMTTIALLYEPDYPGIRLYRRAAERAAETYGMKVEHLEVRTAADVNEAFKSLERLRPDAVLISTTGTIVGNYRRIMEFMATQRLPAIWSASFSIPEGGLMAYSPNFVALARRNVEQIGKILKGIRPAEIPVEEPAEFELTINLRTAKTLGLTVPRTLLMRAQLIE